MGKLIDDNKLQEELKKLDRHFHNDICIVQTDLDALEEELQDAPHNCDDVRECISDVYAGPGLRYLAYDGANLSFQDLVAGTAYPTVNTFANLPAANSVAPPNNIYVVLTTTGVWFINRRERGLYYSDGVTWTRLGDHQSIFVDDVFQVQDNVDPTKVLTFSVDSLVGTAVKTFQSGNGTIAELTDIPTDVIVPVAASPYNAVQVFGNIYLFVDASGGNRIVNIPTAVGNDAKFIIKKIDSSANYVDVVPAGLENIDDDTTHRLLFQNTAISIKSDNTQWWSI